MPSAFAGHDFDESEPIGEDPFRRATMWTVYNNFYYAMENIRGEIVLVHYDSIDKLIDRGYLVETFCPQCPPCPIEFFCEPCEEECPISNNPESIIFTISEQEAIQFAEEFSQDLQGNLNLLDGYDRDEPFGCELLKAEKITVSKRVISGVPYYESEVGLCIGFYVNSLGLGDFSRLLLHQDAVNGTDIFIEHGPSGE